jgi:hypothetical protein
MRYSEITSIKENWGLLLVPEDSLLFCDLPSACVCPANISDLARKETLSIHQEFFTFGITTRHKVVIEYHSVFPVVD